MSRQGILQEQLNRWLHPLIRQPSRLIWLILGLGFILRLAWLVAAMPVPVSDFEGYRWLGEMLLDHHQFGYPDPTSYRLPGYPFFLAVVMLVSRSVPWLSFVNVLLSTALIALIYAVTRRLIASQNVALIAAGIAAVYPIFVFFAPILASEHLFSILFFAGWLALLSPRLPDALRGGLAGLAFGLAMLVRGEAVYYLPVLVLAIYFLFGTWSKRVGVLLILGVSWFVVVFPWYLRNQAVIGPGTGMGTSGGVMLYYGHHDTRLDWLTLYHDSFDGLDEVELNQKAVHLALDYIRTAPFSTQLLETVIKSLRHFAPNDYPVTWSLALPRTEASGQYPQKPFPGRILLSGLTIAGYVLLALASLGSLAFIRRYPLSMWAIVVGSIAVNWFGYAILFASTSRYRYTIEGFLCILGAITVFEVYQKFRQKTGMHRAEQIPPTPARPPGGGSQMQT